MQIFFFVVRAHLNEEEVVTMYILTDLCNPGDFPGDKYPLDIFIILSIFHRTFSCLMTKFEKNVVRTFWMTLSQHPGKWTKLKPSILSIGMNCCSNCLQMIYKADCMSLYPVGDDVSNGVNHPRDSLHGLVDSASAQRVEGGWFSPPAVSYPISVKSDLSSSYL